MQNSQSVQNETQPTSTPQPTDTLPTTQIPPTTTSKKKKPWLLISLVVLLLSTTGVLGYKYYELKQQLDNQQLTPLPSPQLVVSSPEPVTSSDSVDSIVNWQEYKDDGFSFKYPSNWKILTNCKLGEYCVASEDFQQTINEVGGGGGFYIVEKGGAFSIAKSDRTPSMKLDDACHPGGPLIISSCTDTTFNGYKAKKRVEVLHIDGAEYSTSIWLLTDQSLFAIGQNYKAGNQDVLNTMDQILSTFQFTD